MPVARLVRPAVVLAALALLASGGEARATQVTGFPLPVADSSPLGVAAGPDGDVWFTEVAGSRIGRVTPQGAVTDFSTGSGIRAASRPWSIAAGPDGNLWFTEEVGRVARSTTQPVATELTAGLSPMSGPRGIAAGPDGAVWFTEDAGRIGRVTPTGSITEFAAGITLGSRPLDIAAGSDGNLWFTELAGDRIGRITPLGAVTEFGTGISANSQLSDITAGPDGNLWFTEDAGDRIGRITTAGVVTEFSRGITASAQPRGIAAGPDGNVWFTEEAGDRLGRITRAGVVTEFPLKAGVEPTDVTTGRDGDLWFAEAVGNAIGRLALDPSATTGSARLAGDRSATLDGTVIPFSSRASAAFQVGRTTSYGAVVPAAILPPGRGAAAVSAAVTGLAPGTTYHYRLAATNGAGTARGADRTFTTTGAAVTGGGGAPASGDHRAPRVGVAAPPAVRRGGRRVALTLRCPLGETLGCRIAVRLQTDRVVGGRRVVLGTGRFRLRGGQRRVVTVALTRRGRAQVRTHRRLRARLTLDVRDASGNRRTTVRAVTLRR